MQMESKPPAPLGGTMVRDAALQDDVSATIARGAR